MLLRHCIYHLCISTWSFILCYMCSWLQRGLVFNKPASIMDFITISLSPFKAFATIPWKLTLKELIAKISTLQKYSLCLSVVIVESNSTKYGVLKNCYTFICYIFFFFYLLHTSNMLHICYILLHLFPAYNISW